MKAVRFVYNLAFPFVLVALLPSFIARMLKRGKYRHKFGQRFGIYSARVREKLAPGGWTWIHAVSVGEVLIALKFIRELKARDPQLRVVFSTTTSTGFALASKETSDWLEPIYNPVDFLWTARRAMRLIRPRRFIMVEAEIWPNLTAEAKAQGATLALINARLSTRSEKRYQLVKPLVSVVFNQLDLLCVQEPADAARWRNLGVAPEKILCTGSIKFDDAGASGARRDFWPELEKLGVSRHSPVLLAGSTHAGEERLIGTMVLRLRQQYPDLFYLIIPRHAERWREIKEALGHIGFRVHVRAGDDSPQPTDPDVLLANTTGELRDWYDCATVVFVGKSLKAHGGQNPVEAVAAGKAVVLGPNMENFASITAQMVRDGGVVQVADEDGLQAAFIRLLGSPEERAALAANGQRCLEVHRGATVRTCEAIEKLQSR